MKAWSAGPRLSKGLPGFGGSRLLGGEDAPDGNGVAILFAF